MSTKRTIHWRTVIVTGFTTLVISFFLFVGGCRGMIKLIESRRNCESFNIDNYELRTRTNIPRTKDITCHYDPKLLTKSSVFILDLSEKELSRHIEYNELQKISECTYHPFIHNSEWNDSISKLPREQLYTKWGSDKEDSWIYVLDSANQTFWVELIEDKYYVE